MCFSHISGGFGTYSQSQKPKGITPPLTNIVLELMQNPITYARLPARSVKCTIFCADTLKAAPVCNTHQSSPAAPIKPFMSEIRDSEIFNKLQLFGQRSGKSKQDLLKGK